MHFECQQSILVTVSKIEFKNVAIVTYWYYSTIHSCPNWHWKPSFVPENLYFQFHLFISREFYVTWYNYIINGLMIKVMFLNDKHKKHFCKTNLRADFNGPLDDVRADIHCESFLVYKSTAFCPP